MKFKITKELLFTHFMGKTSAMQKQMIDEWALDQANEEQFYRWLEEYESLHPEYDANLDKAIKDYYSFLSQMKEDRDAGFSQEQPSEQVFSRRVVMKWLAAASVMLVLATGAFLTRDFWQYQTYRTAFGETKSFQLLDGSLVTLNANSSLRVPRWGFGKSTRNVFLSGEASFSVKHTDTHQKFVVQTGKKFEVEVLGTEFLVFARKRSSKIVLNKGKVQLNVQVGSKTRKMMMKPGDLITLDNENHASLKTTRQPQMHSAWQGQRYIFEKTTLQEITYLLAENYGIQAEVMDKDLLNLTLSGALTIHNADELLDLIQDVLVLRVTREDNRVYISQSNQ